MATTIKTTPVKTLAEITGTEGIPLSDKTHLNASELKQLQQSIATAEQNAATASANAQSAQQLVQQVSNTLSNLPDGQSVSVQVAENTQKLDDLAAEIGDLSDLNTDVRTSLVDAINEAAQSGGSGGGSSSSSEWELLIDKKTTEEDGAISKFTFTKTKDNYNFSRYRRIMIFMVNQPNPDATTTSVIRLSTSTENAWLGRYYIGNYTSKTVTTFLLSVLEKTPLGVIPLSYYSGNNTNVNCNFSLSAPNTFQASVDSSHTANTASTSDAVGMYEKDFNFISAGSYVNVLGVGSRIVIYGQR